MLADIDGNPDSVEQARGLAVRRQSISALNEPLDPGQLRSHPLHDGWRGLLRGRILRVGIRRVLLKVTRELNCCSAVRDRIEASAL
jgi:hypothetical protein